MNKRLIQSLRDHYHSKINNALAEIELMNTKAVSVAEHSGFKEMYLKWISEITEAEDDLKTLEKHINVP